VVHAIVDPAQHFAFDEDTVLVDRFLGGDAEAFQTLYARYFDRVYSIARGVLLDDDEAADAAQDVFTQAWRNLAKFDRRSKFSTWLFRIAVNRSIQHGRRLKFKKRWSPIHEATESQTPVETEGSDPRVDAALAAVSEEDRAILTMFYWDDLSLEEIGAALDCSANAAKTRLFRARERFRAAYGEDAP
jgi:RNA polymerase sigma-70 factor, ECF subfamily